MVSETAGELVVGPATDARDLAAFVEVYRETFHLPPTDPGINYRLLTGIQRNGGAVIGAWVGGRPVGFVFGFLGHDPRVGYYHYSQAAAVLDGYQGLGIGRRLKLAQRDYVRAQGVTRMRWYFDPLRARNAHFNLNVLGADAVRFERDLFGPAGSGRDEGLATHRLVADWPLDPDPAAGPSTVDDMAPTIAVPADWEGYRQRHGPVAARAMQDRVAEEFGAAFAAGLRAVALRPDGDSARYVLRDG